MLTTTTLTLTIDGRDVDVLVIGRTWIILS
jgi:hypothetical protein